MDRCNATCEGDGPIVRRGCRTTTASAFLATTLALATAVVVAAATTAAAQPMRVTFVARACPSFGDVPANPNAPTAAVVRHRQLDLLGRQEAVGLLGARRPGARGLTVAPERQGRALRRCAPLTGWRFTLGTGLTGVSAEARTGTLSVVRDALPTRIVTQASAPLRDRYGRPIGRRTIAGATTVTLGDHALAASVRQRLLAQGGTPADPLLRAERPGGLQFAALRCGIGTRSGRNAQLVSFPSGVSHVFCIAFYAGAAPGSARKAADGGSGSISIEKATDAGQIEGEAVFVSNVVNESVDDEPGYFFLPLNGRQDFHLAETPAGGTPWQISERDAWPAVEMVDVECFSQNNTSEIRIDRDQAAEPYRFRVTVHLAADDHVECRFFNRHSVGYSITKRTVDAPGPASFRFWINDVDSGSAYSYGASTVYPGRQITLWLNDRVVPIRIDEWAQRTDRGSWRLSAECGGQPWDVDTELAPNAPSERPAYTFVGSLSITPSIENDSTCDLLNRWIPVGSLTIRKRTLNGAGTTGFRIVSADGETVYRQTATTTAAGETVTATGDATEHVELGRYTIHELTADAEEWVLAEVSCNGEPVPFADGAVEVELTAEHPSFDCTFVNARREPPEEPEEPEEPGGRREPREVVPPVEPPPVTERPTENAAVEPTADVTIDKATRTPRVTLGDVAVYDLHVHNRGPGRAEDVVVDEDPDGGARLVGVHPSQGRCSPSLPLMCYLGALGPGETATVTVRLRPTRTGLFRNFAVAGLSTHDPRLAVDNASRSGVRVLRRQRRPSYTG
jgi:hypothetical protein